MKHENNGKRYNDDFRKMVVELYNSGQTASSLSSEYGVSEVTIYAWIKKFNPVELEDGTSVTPDDYAKLQKQLLKLQQENDIFSKSSINLNIQISIPSIFTKDILLKYLYRNILNDYFIYAKQIIVIC